MQLETLPIADLKPAPYNPRIPLQPGTPAYERLERSLREFDLVQPIVWNRRTGHVVAGHQRIEILKTKGATTVDAVVVDLTLEREKALNITLNNSQVGSDWDTEKLTEVLAELSELPDIDATLTGFDHTDLKDLLLAPDPAPPNDFNDEPPDDSVVRVALEIPEDDWDDVRPELDDVIARHNLIAHVRTPSAEP